MKSFESNSPPLLVTPNVTGLRTGYPPHFTANLTEDCPLFPFPLDGGGPGLVQHVFRGRFRVDTQDSSFALVFGSDAAQRRCPGPVPGVGGLCSSGVVYGWSICELVEGCFS